MTDYLRTQLVELCKLDQRGEPYDEYSNGVAEVLELLDQVRCKNCAYWGSERLNPNLSQRCAHLEAGPVMIPAERGSVRGTTTEAQIYTRPDFYCAAFQNETRQ